MKYKKYKKKVETYVDSGGNEVDIILKAQKWLTCSSGVRLHIHEILVIHWNESLYIFYIKGCPDGYTVVEFGTTVTCLRFVSTRTGYYNASLQCQGEGGDLVRMESPDYIPILQNLLSSDEWRNICLLPIIYSKWKI